MRSTNRGGEGRWAATVVALAAVGALAAGCGGDPGAMSESAGGGSADSVDDSASQRGALSGEPMGPDGPPAADGRSTTPGSANRPVVQTRAVIRKGEISLVTKEMNRARTEIDDLLGRRGGYIASEDTTNDRAGRPEYSVLVLRVPEPAFDDAMTALGDIGRTEHADRSSEDVTTEVIDVDARVATQEASIARLQKLLDQATDIADMVRIESEIATRQADLESLEAQQKYLHDQTAMSTITVRLRAPDTPPPPGKDDSGFLAGLRDGWGALTAVLVGAATVAGAVLPFAATLALLGLPLWLLVRAAARRRHTTPPPTAPEPS